MSTASRFSVKTVFFSAPCIFLLLMLFIFAATSFGSPSVYAQDSTPRRAVISALEGSVLVQAAGEAAAVPARRNMEIKSGDRIITGRDGTAEIRYDDGSISRIGPGSRVDISNISRQGADGAETTVISAQRGGVWNNAREIVDRNSRFEVNTPAAVAAVRGTNFMVRVAAAGETLVRVYEGLVGLGPAPDALPEGPGDALPPPPPPPTDQEIMVNPYQQASFVPQQPPPPAPDSLDFDDVDDFELYSLAEDSPGGFSELVNKASELGLTEFLEWISELIEGDARLQQLLQDYLDSIRGTIAASRQPPPAPETETDTSPAPSPGPSPSPKQVAVKATVEDTTEGTVTGGGTFNHGSSVTVTAEPKEGYIFVNWTEDEVEVSTDASYTFTASADRKLVANFIVKPVYTLTYSAETGGSIVGLDEQSVLHGEDGDKVTAEPIDDSYYFEGWCDGVATASRTDTNVTENIAVTATFAKKEYQVNLVAAPVTGGGTVTGGGVYVHGSDVTVSAAVYGSGDFQFEKWTENGSSVSTDPSISFVATKDRFLVANYKENVDDEDPDLGGLFSGGDGTQGDPYRISSSAHLDNIRFHLNSYFKLANDINLSGVDWIPIGSDSSPFTGHLDGNGNTINNLSIDRDNSNKVGLFGTIDAPATITDVKLYNVDVTAKNNSAALVGQNHGTISGCSVENGTVTGNNNVGSLVGLNNGTVSGSSDADVTVSGNNNVGGIVGLNNGTID